nr:n-alpha-acetyltransferase 35, natc auxiliary subunit [Quercus suber]
MSADSPAEHGVAAASNKNVNNDIAIERLANGARHAVPLQTERNFREITTSFAQATRTLQHGQLVKDEFFTLFEAVGALEASEIVWIMDQLLYLEIIWHEGYPLSQTVFSSLYIDRLLDPDNAYPYNFEPRKTPQSDSSIASCLVHKVLRAFCVGQLKCCQLVLHTIQSQNFYEEEDFITHLFGRELLPRLNMVEAVRLLGEAIGWLDNAELPDQLRQALRSRLQFRKDFLNCAGGDECHWSELTAFVTQIQQSHTLGCPIPEAFSDKVQRQLATSTPPRPMLALTWDETCQKWMEMFTSLSETTDLTSLPICQSPAGLQRAIWVFSYLDPQPNTYTRACFQDILFGTDRITPDITHFDLLLTDIRELVLAGHCLADPQSFQVEMPSDRRHICSRLIENFMDKAFDEYMNLYRMVCQNRCRIRRTFTQAIPIWDNIESEAIRVDLAIDEVMLTGRRTNDFETTNASRPLSTWAKYHKLQLMVRTIQLGFETDIYLLDELCEMYRLLYTFENSLYELLDRIDTVLLERMRTLTKTRRTRYITEALLSQDWVRSLKLQHSVARSMSRALSCLYGALYIKPPKRPYATKHLLYEARMKPFLNIVNDHIPDFTTSTQPSALLHDAAKAIDTDIRSAKALLQQLKKVTPEQGKYFGTEVQWKREIKQWETTCVAIAVQTTQLVRTCEKAGKSGLQPGDDLMEVIIPPLGKRYHDWWLVPQLKNKAQMSSIA